MCITNTDSGWSYQKYIWNGLVGPHLLGPFLFHPPFLLWIQGGQWRKVLSLPEQNYSGAHPPSSSFCLWQIKNGHKFFDAPCIEMEDVSGQPLSLLGSGQPLWLLWLAECCWRGPVEQPQTIQRRGRANSAFQLSLQRNRSAASWMLPASACLKPPSLGVVFCTVTHN